MIRRTAFLVGLILVCLSTTAWAAGQTGPKIEGLAVTDQEQCRLSGSCNFNFQIVEGDDSWSPLEIFRNAFKVNSEGDALYSLALDTGDDLFQGSLKECLLSRRCKVKGHAITFKNRYDRAGWYGVQVTLTKNDPQDPSTQWDRINHWTMLHTPVCLFEESKSEGWYWADLAAQNRDEAYIIYADCAKADAPQCEAIGSRSEGWYADNWTPYQEQLPERLIAWDFCHQAAGYALSGEKCGPGIAKCYGDHLTCEAGICAEKEAPVCLTYHVEGGESTAFYAINFNNAEQALGRLDELVDADGQPIYVDEDILPDTCLGWAESHPVIIELYAPVCGSPAEEKATTYPSVYHFRNAIMTKAGDDSESKGKYVPGECPEPEPEPVCLYYETTTPAGDPLNNIYALNLKRYEDAKEELEEIAYFQNEKIFEGNCLKYAETIPYVRLWAPLCSDYPEENTQYGNFNEFKRAVVTGAGVDGQNKGHFDLGECPQ